MNLQDILIDVDNPVNAISALNSPKKQLDIKKYSDLYDYFRKYHGQSYHSLVDSSKTEEYYLLMNDQDLILMMISAYSIDFKIEGSLLTIYISLYDNKDTPLNVPFIYSLDNLDSLFELNRLINQSKINFFFIESINNILTIEYKIEILIPDDFKKHLNFQINMFIEENYNDELEEER